MLALPLLLACSARILAAGGDNTSRNARPPARAGPAAARGGAAAVPMNLNVLPNGLLGFSSFRGPSLLQIPGPSPDGLLLASGVGRSPKGGDAGGLGIVMRRSRDGGKHWEPPMLVGNASELVYSGAIPDGLYNGAALHDHQTNTTFLSWGQCIEKCRPGRAPQRWTAPSYMLTRSTDGFTSWATTNLTATIGAAVNHLFPDNYYGNGLQLRNGHLLMCGSQMDFDNPPPGKKADATDGGFCVSSSDHGTSWTRGGTFAHNFPPCGKADGGCTKMQMRAGQFSNGSLLVMGHSPSPPGEAFANSPDNGLTFTKPWVDGRLPTTTQSDLLVIPEANDLILVSHDFSRSTCKTDGCSRLNLTVSVSADYMRTWRHVPLLSSAGGKTQPHFSGSSCMTAMAGPAGVHSVAVLFEGGAKRFDGDGLWFSTVPLTVAIA